jgi:hypothetical protein
MKANELRIGNYVKGIGHNIAWLVEGIEKDYIYTSDHWRLLSSFEGMPLTEEELINLGLKKVSDRVFMKGDFGVELGFFNFFLIKVDGHVLRIGNNEHVHQLQNLYFALTGEELTYKC